MFILAEDSALKTYLQGMTVGDEKSATRPVKVWFGYPDVEVRDQSFPFVTIDLIDIVPANTRQHQGVLIDDDYRGTIAPVSGLSYSYQYPVAYDLSYQITTYSRHPRHDRAILFQMHNKFPSKYGKLPVPNELGTEVAMRSMFLDGFIKRDAVDGETGNRRLLRNVYSVTVVSEMTPAIAAQAINEVETININIPNPINPPTTPYIPDTYETV